MINNVIQEKLDTMKRSKMEKVIETLGYDRHQVEKMTNIDLMELFESNHDFRKSLFESHANHFALHPSELEKCMEIKRAERLRWQEQGKLKVLYYKSIRKWGKNLKTPYFCLHHILSLDEKDIENWRAEHQRGLKLKRLESSVQAQKTKALNDSLRKANRESYEREIEKWYGLDEKIGVSFELAYWTVWISRWAKVNQMKSKRARKHEKKYNRQKENLYDMKNQAIFILNESDYSQLSFYAPDCPNKISVEFCFEHYQYWRRLRSEYGYYEKMAFYHDHKNTIKKCRRCEVDFQRDHYSLYHLQVTCDQLEVSFSFHTPYPIANKVLPLKSKLKQVVHEEQEGMFRFGRVLTDKEMIIYKEKHVITRFNEAVSKFKDIYDISEEQYHKFLGL